MLWIKFKDDLYILLEREWHKKMILQLFTNLRSITAASNSWNIAFYCGRIFAKLLSNSKIK